MPQANPRTVRLQSVRGSRYVELLQGSITQWASTGGTPPSMPPAQRVPWPVLVGLPIIDKVARGDAPTRIFTILALLGFARLYGIEPKIDRRHVMEFDCWPSEDGTARNEWSAFFKKVPDSSIFKVPAGHKGRPPKANSTGLVQTDRVAEVTLQSDVVIEIPGVSRRVHMGWQDHAAEWLSENGVPARTTRLIPIHAEPDWFQPMHRENCLPIGSHRTFWVMADGDGTEEYLESNLIIRSLATEMSLREEFRPHYDRVAEALRSAKRQNGPLFAMRGYLPFRSEDGVERLCAELTFEPCSYFDFITTCIANETAEERGKILSAWNPTSQPLPDFPNGVGICMCLITSDKQWVFSRRSDNPTHVSPRRGEWDVAVVEGLNPTRSKLTSSGSMSHLHEARAGLKEELGLLKCADEDIHVLGFGVDLEYYQWNLIGYATSNLTAEEIRQSRLRHAKDRNEISEFGIVDANPKAIFEFLADKRIWSSGLAATYYSLVHHLGPEEVDLNARAYFRKRFE